ncbi:MAG TPA: hypothetical protein VI306_14445 [Pyrinomonadaceae bacterium]
MNIIYRGIIIRCLQAALIVLVLSVGWLIYHRLPVSPADEQRQAGKTSLQIVIERPSETGGMPLDVTVELYPVDLVAVRHEFFTEPRAGKRFDDFLKERMKGRSPVTAHLDKQGSGAITIAPGSWWLHAKLSGDEEIEWRLPITVSGAKQTLQLTSQNAYTRSKTF